MTKMHATSSVEESLHSTSVSKVIPHQFPTQAATVASTASTARDELSNKIDQFPNGLLSQHLYACFRLALPVK